MAVAIDSFSGAGGLSLGLKTAGFSLGAAFDSDQRCVDTYQQNLGAHGFRADARDITGPQLMALASVSDLGLLAGGPPCQGFSKQKRRDERDDERNALVLEHLRLIDEIRPRSFLVENVPMIAGQRGAHLLGRFRILRDYDITGSSYVAADYGVAQTRQRFIMVGVRKDQPGRYAHPPPTTPAPCCPTIGQALAGLPEPPSDFSTHPEYANHHRSMVTQQNIDRFAHVPEGGGWADIPYELRCPRHQVTVPKNGGWPDVYGRLRWDGQCPTITGGFDSFTRGRFGHPKHDRPLTAREAARLQGFPDVFVFLGSRRDVRRQIGNAVPVPLAMAVGRAILDAIGE